MKFFTFGIDPKAEQEEYNENPTLNTHSLGGKGSGLIWMTMEGIPVPPGFVIPVSVWEQYNDDPKGTMEVISETLSTYMEKLKYHFGYMPLVSVRSGSRVSCPGMMDTILNVGLDSDTIGEWTTRLGPVCAEDNFIRLLAMYGKVVKGIPHQVSFAEPLEHGLDTYKKFTGEPFPDAQAQLVNAIEAVFKSWDNPRAHEYRKLNHIPREYGTAVVVQAMVFGNLNDQSGTGVMFSRNPNTGEALVTGEYLKKAQGEDIVAGGVTPKPFTSHSNFSDFPQLQDAVNVAWKLEKLKKDVQDIEFTVQDGTLYILQTRTAKRSAVAALRIAVEMATHEKIISEKEAVSRVSLKQYDQAQLVQLDPSFKGVKAKPVYTGISACSGIVTGKPVFSSEDAVASKEPCILITEETTPEDIAGMNAAVGVITMVGGFTCHAGVVARGMNRACIVGVGKPVHEFKMYPVLSMDGGTGHIWTKDVPIIKPETNGVLREFMAMMYRVVGALPIYTKAPLDSVKEAVLYLGDQVIHTKQAAQEILKAVQKVETLYLDLEPAGGTHDFFSLFDIGVDTFELRLIQELIKLSTSEPTLNDRLVILNGSITGGFKKVEFLPDLESLILSQGHVQIDAGITPTPAMAKVLEWKKGELNLLSVGQMGTVDNMKSFLSPQHVLQLIAKEP